MGVHLITTGVMSKKSTHKEAYDKALEELQEEEVAEVKEIVKVILQKQQEYKEQKEEAEEALRLLKLDLEDLKEGKIEKIGERHLTSNKAQKYSPIDLDKIKKLIEERAMSIPDPWSINTAGYVSTGGTIPLSMSEPIMTNLSPPIDKGNLTWVTTTANIQAFGDAVSGTYIIKKSDGTKKEFYL
jgi:hypothetical protein